MNQWELTQAIINTNLNGSLMRRRLDLSLLNNGSGISCMTISLRGEIVLTASGHRDAASRIDEFNIPKRTPSVSTFQASSHLVEIKGHKG